MTPIDRTHLRALAVGTLANCEAFHLRTQCTHRECELAHGVLALLDALQRLETGDGPLLDRDQLLDTALGTLAQNKRMQELVEGRAIESRPERTAVEQELSVAHEREIGERGMSTLRYLHAKELAALRAALLAQTERAETLERERDYLADYAERLEAQQATARDAATHAEDALRAALLAQTERAERLEAYERDFDAARKVLEETGWSIQVGDLGDAVRDALAEANEKSRTRLEVRARRAAILEARAAALSTPIRNGISLMSELLKSIDALLATPTTPETKDG